jgi:hypothetical protein
MPGIALQCKTNSDKGTKGKNRDEEMAVTSRKEHRACVQQLKPCVFCQQRRESGAYVLQFVMQKI